MPTAPFTLEQAEEAIADLRAQVDRMGEVHALDGTGGVVPNAQPGQAQLYTATDGQPAYVTPAGLAMGSMGAQQAWFPGNTVTAASLANLSFWTIPANDAAVGAVYEIEVQGNGTQGSTAQTLEFAVMLGGNTLSNLTLGANFMAASSTFRWHMVARAITLTTGAGGTWQSLLCGEVSVAGTSLLSSGASSANATSGVVSCEAAATTAVDTTADQTLGLSAAWGSTTGAPALVSRVAIAKRIC